MAFSALIAMKYFCGGLAGVSSNPIACAGSDNYRRDDGERGKPFTRISISVVGLAVEMSDASGTVPATMMCSPPALRLLCAIEGISLLLLLGVAMPLKYLADLPLAVRYVGMAHGLLWIALCVVLAAVAWRLRWSKARSGAVFLSSLLPFGFLIIDRRMRAWGAETASGE